MMGSEVILETKNFYQEIGRCIRKVRKERRITQEELGRQLGLTKSAIVNYETGIRKIPVDVLAEFSSRYQISIDTLIKKEETLADIIHSQLGDMKLTQQQEQLLIQFINTLVGER